MAPPPPKAALRTPVPRWAWAAGAALLLLSLWLLLRPSPLRGVKNLDSRGTAVVAFGDSLTRGVGAGPGEDYPAVLAGALGLEIYNAGVSGDTTADALRRLEGDVLALDPRVVLVGLGGNDFLRGRGMASAESGLRETVRRVQEGGAAVVLLGFSFPSLTEDWEGMYARVAAEEGCLLVPRVLRGIQSDEALKSDAIHPNAAGYRLVAQRVEGPLRDLLEEMGAPP